VRLRNGRPVATREYFPRNFRAATRQRSRWVAGIVLQGWEHHGWRGAWPQAYWFWRDRKGLIGNLVSPLANLYFLAGLGFMVAGGSQHWHIAALVPLWLSKLCLVSYGIALVQVAVRMWCSASIYGRRFAAAVPVRVAWSNVVNFMATVAAIRQYAGARIGRRAISWRKTDHVYPRPRLREVLVRLGMVSLTDIEAAASTRPEGMRLGEHLIQLRKLTEENLYRALSVQAGIPAGRVDVRDVDRLATRLLPADASRRWKVLPFRVETGQLHVATADVPTQESINELAKLSALEIRYRLVRPVEFARLAGQYLPLAA
jgi:bacteriophage N4 adsorption protein B